MKKSLILILVTNMVLISSCYKKLYFNCVKDKEIFQHQNDNLLNENSIVKFQENEVQKQTDSLSKEFDLMTQNNLALIAEKKRLIKISEDEIMDVNKAIIDYFDKVAKLAVGQLPPCPNAANGHFRDNMTGGDVSALANPSLTVTTQNAFKLLTLFKTFANRNQAAFIGNQNYDPGGWPAVIMWTKDFFGKIGDVIYSIFSLINSDGKDDKKNAEAAVAAAGLYQAVMKNSNCHSGTHANGWISVRVNESAQLSLQLLNSYGFNDPSTRIGKIKIVLEKTFRALIGLQTQGHEPWLLADWQLKYYSIMKATTLALQNVD